MWLLQRDDNEVRYQDNSSAFKIKFLGMNGDKRESFLNPISTLFYERTLLQRMYLSRTGEDKQRIDKKEAYYSQEGERSADEARHEAPE